MFLLLLLSLVINRQQQPSMGWGIVFVAWQFQFIVCGAETLFLSDTSRITPSIVNRLCNPPPSLLPLCLQSLSVHIVLKMSREVLELFLQPGLQSLSCWYPNSCREYHRGKCEQGFPQYNVFYCVV